MNEIIIDESGEIDRTIDIRDTDALMDSLVQQLVDAGVFEQYINQ